MGLRPRQVLMTALKLLLASVVVGAVMMLFDWSPEDIYLGAWNLLKWAWNRLVELLGGQWGAAVLAGASVVVPIWAILAVIRHRRRR